MPEKAPLIETREKTMTKNEQQILDTFEQSGIPEFVRDRGTAHARYVGMYDNLNFLELDVTDEEGNVTPADISPASHDGIRAWALSINEHMQDPRIAELFKAVSFDETYVTQDADTKKKEVRERTITLADVVYEYQQLKGISSTPDEPVFLAPHELSDDMKKRSLRHIKVCNKRIKKDTAFAQEMPRRKEQLEKITHEITAIQEIVDMYHAIAMYTSEQKVHHTPREQQDN